MRYSFTSRSLFHEARLLRFSGEVQKPEATVPPVEKPDTPTDLIDGARGLEKDGPAGPEKVEALNAEVEQLQERCKKVLKDMQDRGAVNPKWNEIYGRYFKELQGITEKGNARIGALSKTLEKLGVEFRATETYDQAKLLADGIRSHGNADDVETEANLNRLNGILLAMPEGERMQWLSKYKLDRDGTSVNGADGADFSFTQNPDGTLKMTRRELKAKEQPAANQDMTQADFDKRIRELDKKNDEALATPLDAAPAKQGPSLEQGLKVNELSETQRGALKVAKEMTTAVTKGDMATMEAKLAELNVYLTDNDPAESRALTDSWKLTLASGDKSFGRVMVDNKQRDVIFYMDGDTLKYRISVPTDAKQEKPQVELDPAGTDKGEGNPKKVIDALKDNPLFQDEGAITAEKIKAELPKLIEQANGALDGMKEALPLIQQFVDKHADTLVKAYDAMGPEGLMAIAQNPEAIEQTIDGIADKQKWPPELKADVQAMIADARALIADVQSKFSPQAKDKNGKPRGLGDLLPKKGDAPAAPGEKPADAKKGPEKNVDGLTNAANQLNQKVEMTQEEKDDIVAQGKSLIEEFKKNENPTASQKEQLRGQLMMAGVNADGGVDALIKDPSKLSAKEGTAMQVGLNRLMGLIVYVVSVVKEMQDMVKGKTDKADETPESKERSRIMRDMFDITRGIAEKNQDQAFSAKDSAADLQTLSKLDADYGKLLTAPPFDPKDITRLVGDLRQAQIDKVGSVQDQDDQTFKKLSFDAATKQYVFVPAEDAPADGAKQKDKPADTPADKPKDKPADTPADGEPQKRGLSPDKPTDTPEAPAPNFEQMEAERFDLQQQLDALNAKPFSDFKTEQDAVDAVKERKVLEKKIADLEAAIKELKEPKTEAENEPETDKEPESEKDAGEELPEVPAPADNGDVPVDPDASPEPQVDALPVDPPARAPEKKEAPVDPLVKFDELIADGTIDAADKDVLLKDGKFKEALAAAPLSKRTEILARLLTATDGMKGPDGKTLRQSLENASSFYNPEKGGWYSALASTDYVRSQAEAGFKKVNLTLQEGEMLVQTYQAMA